MGKSTSKKIDDNNQTPAPGREPVDRLANTDGSCKSPAWGPKLTQAVISALSGGVIRAVLDRVLNDFHP
jgi:hypothetical protein